MSPTFVPALLRISAFGLVVAALCGCSADSKKSAHLSKGGQFFASGDYEKAELEYKNVLQIDRINPEAIARLGVIYFDQGRTGPTLMYLRKGNELQPKNTELRLRLVKTLVGFGPRQFEEARTLAHPLLDQTPPHEEAAVVLAEATATPKDYAEIRARLLQLPNQSASVLTGLAILDLREQKQKDAETLVARALAAEPKLSAANTLNGFLSQSNKDLPKAEKAFVAATASAPARAASRMQLVNFYLQTNQIEAGKRVLEENFKKAPDSIPTRIAMAGLAANDKRFDESITHLERVLAMDPTHFEALLLAAKVRLAKGEPSKAVALLETATKTYPGAAIAHHQLGLAYVANSESGKATASFTEAIALAPSAPEPAIALAELNLRQRNFGPAIAGLRLLLQKGESSEARFLLGNAYRLQGTLDEALATYRQLFPALPKSHQLRLFTGLVLIQQNKLAEGRVEIAKAAELAPEEFAPVELLVNLDVAEKKFDAARQRVDDLVAKKPTEAAPQLLLARVYLAQSDVPRAETALRKAIELQPNSMDGYMMLAELYVSRNETAKALTDLLGAAAANPKDPRPNMISAILHERQKNYPAARENYEKTLAINPQNGIALNNLAALYLDQDGKLDRALELAQKARELLPNQPEVADTLGWIFFKKRNYTRALALFDEAAEKLSETAEFQYHLGMACYMTGDETRATAALEKALKLDANFPGADDAKKALAVTTGATGADIAAFRATLEKTVATRPGDSIAQNRLGLLLEKEGNRDKALAAFENAIKASPTNVNATLNAFRLYRERNELSKAVELGKSARKSAPSNAKLAHALGQVGYGTADFAWAHSLLQEAKRQLPDDPEVSFDLGLAAYSVGRVADAETAVRDALKMPATFSRSANAKSFLELLALGANPTSEPAGAAIIDTALKADPANVPALMAKAVQAQTNRDSDTARQSFEKALARFPAFSPAQRGLALVYSEKNIDDKKGLEIATKAREAFPNDLNVARALGLLSYRTGNYSRAASLLQECTRASTNEAELWYFLGMAQHQLKDQTAASKSLKRALELNLKSDLALEARRTLEPKDSPKKG